MTDKTSVAASNNPWNRGPLRVKTPNELDDEVNLTPDILVTFQ